MQTVGNEGKMFCIASRQGEVEARHERSGGGDNHQATVHRKGMEAKGREKILSLAEGIFSGSLHFLRFKLTKHGFSQKLAHAEAGMDVRSSAAVAAQATCCVSADGAGLLAMHRGVRVARCHGADSFKLTRVQKLRVVYTARLTAIPCVARLVKA